MEGGGGKGVNRVFWKCFFHYGEGRGFDYGGRGRLKPPGLQQTSQQRRDKGCTLILFIYTVEGEGGGGMEFIFMVPSLEMWKEEGGKGLIGFSGNCLIFFYYE